MVSSMSSDQALALLTPEERAWVEQLRNQVSDLIGPRLRDFRIFGSKVRGDAHEESDVDVLVLVRDLDFALWKELSLLAHSISPLLGVVIEDFEAYHAPRSRATGFYKEMRKESVRL